MKRRKCGCISTFICIIEHANKSSNNVILPLCDLHQKYWEDQEGLLKRATCVCIALGLDTGLRASNLTKAEMKREEHCMMADDLPLL